MIALAGMYYSQIVTLANEWGYPPAFQSIPHARSRLADLLGDWAEKLAGGQGDPPMRPLELSFDTPIARVCVRVSPVHEVKEPQQIHAAYQATYSAVLRVGARGPWIAVNFPQEYAVVLAPASSLVVLSSICRRLSPPNRPMLGLVVSGLNAFFSQPQIKWNAGRTTSEAFAWVTQRIRSFPRSQ